MSDRHITDVCRWFVSNFSDFLDSVGVDLTAVGGKKRKRRRKESCAGSDCDHTALISRFTASFELSHPFVSTSHSLGLPACSQQPV